MIKRQLALAFSFMVLISIVGLWMTMHARATDWQPPGTDASTVKDTVPSVEKGHFQGHHNSMQGLFAQLNLDPDQKERLKTIVKRHHDADRQNAQSLKIKRRHLMEMLRTGDGSKSQALALQQEIAKQHNTLMADHISMMYDVKSVLTPMQFQKFQGIMEQRLHNKRQFNTASQTAPAFP